VKFWDDVSLEAVKRIVAYSNSFVENPSMESLRQVLDEMIEEHFEEGPEVPASSWIALGGEAYMLGCKLQLITDSPRDYCIKTARFVTGKQRDYGTENVARFGGRGLLVRAHDKVARLENLRGRGAAAANEPLSDTIVDLVGYSIVGVLWAENDFFQPLNPDPNLFTVAETEANFALQKLFE
jgi:hypothetical protein